MPSTWFALCARPPLPPAPDSPQPGPPPSLAADLPHLPLSPPTQESASARPLLTLRPPHLTHWRLLFVLLPPQTRPTCDLLPRSSSVPCHSCPQLPFNPLLISPTPCLLRSLVALSQWPWRLRHCPRNAILALSVYSESDDFSRGTRVERQGGLGQAMRFPSVSWITTDCASGRA